MRGGIALLVASLALTPATAEARRSLTLKAASDAAATYVFDQGFVAIAGVAGDDQAEIDTIEATAPDRRDCARETARVVNCHYSLAGILKNKTIWRREGEARVTLTQHHVRVSERRYTRVRWPTSPR